MRDGATGRSRGFGFLTFKDPKTVNIVMVKEHVLDGKIVSSIRNPISVVSKVLGSYVLDNRLTPNEQSPVKSRRRLARFSLAVFHRRRLTMSFESTLHNSGVWWMPPS
jgi:RNA recognition motif-containing protein